MEKLAMDKYMHIRINLQRLVRKDRHYNLNRLRWEQLELEHNVQDILDELAELANMLR